VSKHIVFFKKLAGTALSQNTECLKNCFIKKIKQVRLFPGIHSVILLKKRNNIIKGILSPTPFQGQMGTQYQISVGLVN
jgi:hypothetical protein